MNADQVLAVAAGAAAALGLFLLVIGVVLRRPPLRELGLAALVGSVVLAASRGPSNGGDWALFVGPMVACLGEGARVVTDARRRSHHQHIERSCRRAAAGCVGVMAAVGVVLGALGGALPSSLWPHTVPSGMLPIGMALLVGLVAGLAWGLGRLGRRRQAARRPLVAVAGAMVGLGVATTALASAARAELPGRAGDAGNVGLTGTAAEGGPTVAEAVAQRGRVLPKLPTLGDPGALTVLVLAVLVLVVLVILTRRMQLVPPEDLVPDPLVRASLEPAAGAPLTVQTVDRAVTVAVLDEALVELRHDADPRVAVRLAYAIVSRGLGDPSLARRTAESEGEYLQRALLQLGAGATPLGELTQLFWRARFSEELVDEPMRAAALAALQQIRAEVDSRAIAGVIGVNR